jgi:type IV secretory pathway TrbD component
VTLNFHINDLYQPGVVLTTVCAISGLLAVIFLILTLRWPKHATGSLKIQAWIFTFLSLWLLATQIPYTDFVANRSARIDAFLDGQQLPAQVVQATLAADGESAKYNKLHPAVLLAIFPWIALLFATVLIFILFAAARRRVPSEMTSQLPISEGEKRADL